MKVIPLVGIVAGLALSLPIANAAGEAEFVQQNCASCHALTQPDYEALGVAERAERKGPPLYYAGNKFREEWLVEWLQAPERIRPGGVFAPAHAVSTPEGDVIDPETLIEHPVLSAAEAESAAKYLMTLRPYDDLVAAQSYEPGPINLRIGQMNFSKFKGCDSCHRDAPDFGGVSGPELYTAWERLQPAFIASYIADPTAWDPHTMMPRGSLPPEEVKKLADYLKALSEVE
ncbi:MAG TPA: c-type cytochrome [Gammaproteobacteria bacterium]